MHESPVKKIENDHRSGAAALTSAGIDALIAFLREDTSREIAGLLIRFETMCSSIIQAQPFMASIRNIIGGALKEAHMLQPILLGA